MHLHCTHTAPYFLSVYCSTILPIYLNQEPIILNSFLSFYLLNPLNLLSKHFSNPSSPLCPLLQLALVMLPSPPAYTTAIDSNSLTHFIPLKSTLHIGLPEIPINLKHFYSSPFPTKIFMHTLTRMYEIPREYDSRLSLQYYLHLFLYDSETLNAVLHPHALALTFLSAQYSFSHLSMPDSLPGMFIL